MTDRPEFDDADTDIRAEWSVAVEREVEGVRLCYTTWEITGEAVSALAELLSTSPRRDEFVDPSTWLRDHVGLQASLMYSFPEGVTADAARLTLELFRDDLRQQLNDDDLAAEGIPDLGDIPIPVFGSPPHEWKGLAETISAAGAAGFMATAVTVTDKPVIALVAGGALTVFWFAKPHARLVRDYSTARLDRRLTKRMRALDAEAEEEEANEQSPVEAEQMDV